MSSGIQAVTEAAQTHIAGFQPTSRGELHDFFTDLPEMFRTLGTSLSQAAEHLSGEHVHAAVIDMLRELGGVAGGVADQAEQTYAAHTQQHDLWLTD